MNMADGGCQGIGGIRTHGAPHAQQRAYHFLDLILGRSSVSDHGNFDFRGRVFRDTHLMFRRREKRNAARLAEFQGTLNVAREKNFFKTYRGRMVALDDLVEAAVNLAQSLRQSRRRVRPDDPMRAVTKLIGVYFDEAPARHQRTGIDS